MSSKKNNRFHGEARGRTALSKGAPLVSEGKIKPELVCPAGEWRSLVTAVDSGADSVYFGIKDINMRAKANNFDISQLKKIMDLLHQRSKKGYLALNVIVMDHQLDKVNKILLEAKAANVDAVVLWDMAALSMARNLGLTVHLSTQASVSNAAALEFYANIGVRRAVLARECTLADITAINRTVREKNIPCQIETFVHGAMCVSVSGRCFMSAHAFGKSANQGLCKQPCRREFLIKDKKNETEFLLGSDYVLSPKDLCTIDFIDQLLEAGIHAFKIEGRMRAVEYGKQVISAYREAIDAFFENKLTPALKTKLKERLASVYNRGFSTGFYFGTPRDWISPGYQKSFDKIYLGEVVKFYQKINVAEIRVLNETLTRGDQLLIIGRTTPASFTRADELQREHEFVSTVKRGLSVGVKVPFKVRGGDQVFLWKEKYQNELDKSL